MHSRMNTVELGLAKVRYCPPDAGIDQSEDLLARVCVSALRDVEISHSRIEGRIDPAVVEVVLSGANISGPSLPLRGKWIQGQHTMLRLTELRVALQHRRLRLLVLGVGRLHLCLRQSQLRSCLLHSLLPRRHSCPRLIHLINSDELLCQQWFNAVKIIGLIDQLGRSTIENRPCISDIGLCFVDGRSRAIDVRRRTRSIRLRSPHGAYLRSDGSALVDDLSLQGIKIGSRLLQRILVRPWIDLKEQSPLLDKGVVLYS